jgi:hypothetical protein
MGWLLCIQGKSFVLPSGKVSQWDLDQFVQSAFFHPVQSIVTVLTVLFKQWWKTAKDKDYNCTSYKTLCIPTLDDGQYIEPIQFDGAPFSFFTLL